MSIPFPTDYASKILWIFAGMVLGCHLFAEKPLHREIDKLVKSRAGDVSFAKVADDTTFLRRVSLDLTGNIPTTKEVTVFLNDKSSDKRSDVIERFLKGE